MKLSQKSLLYKVSKVIKENKLISPDERIIVAVSGGVDSVCLFDILYKLKKELKIELLVCHYNHRLRGRESYNDARFVEKLCQDRGAEFILGEAGKENLFKNEEEARVARYEFFEKILKEGRGDKIALAHNSNDFVETTLMRLTRGSGLKGLVSIAMTRENFIRPLLPFSRKEIEEYVKEHNINYRNDKTNKNIHITRNFFRLKIIPLFEKNNPSFIKTMYGSISSIREDFDFLETFSKKEFKNILIERSKGKVILDRKKWSNLHPSLKKMTLRIGLEQLQDLKDITNKQISEICGVIEKGEGKKYKPLPYSLRVALVSGRITIYKERKGEK